MGELLLAAVIFLLAGGVATPRRLALLGVLAGLLAANRPTDIFFSIALAGFVLFERRAAAWPFFLAAAPIGALLVAYNLTQFGALAGGYARYPFPNNRPFGLGPFGVSGFAGLLFSNRGIFFFSPFALLFFFRKWRSPERIRGLHVLLAAYLGSLFLYGLSFDWMGGYCYGPRYAIHGLPVLMAALVEPLERIWSLAWARVAFVAAVSLSIGFQILGAFFYPNGDSGNWHHGVWTIRNSPPVLALRGGPAMPAFLFLFAPRLATRSPLTGSDSSCRLAWSSPPPERIQIGRPVALPLRVTNLGSTHWSSIGGPLNRGGVRIHVAWTTGDPGGTVLAESSRWLAWDLEPGRSVERDVTFVAPPATGSVNLLVELAQDHIGSFPPSSCAPLRAHMLLY
jgi:hypothetical protein